MTASIHTPVAGDATHHHLTVQVRYPAAPRPFIDSHVSPTETVGQLKARILDAFEVSETSGPDGQTLYILYHEDERLDDMARTLGQIAGHEHVLKLKLVQQLVQG